MGGCLPSRKVFVVNPQLEGQDEAAMEVFQTLGLSKREIDLLYTCFWDIDADGSGLIRPSELFRFFELEETSFELAIFSIFDEDASGVINFLEFVCTLWNILTIPQSECGSIAYLMKDPTAVKSIAYSDVKAIIESMHKRKVDKDPVLQSIYAKLRRDFPPDITLQDFVRFTCANPSITSPLMMLQLHIRRQILGEAFWERLTAQRSANPEQSALDYVKRLQASVIQNNAAFAKRQQAEEAERIRLARLGRGAEGDRRDNIQRKESRLLSFFGMKRGRSLPSVGRARQAVVPYSGSSKSAKPASEAIHKYAQEMSSDVAVIVPTARASPATSSHKKKIVVATALRSTGAAGEGEDMAARGVAGGDMPEYNPNVHLQARGSVVHKSSGKGGSQGAATTASPAVGTAGEAAGEAVGEDGVHGTERRDRKRKPADNRRRRSRIKPDLLV